jgi:hypothetical protein
MVGTSEVPRTSWRDIMGEAARSLDDVSDHLGEVLRRADALLAEWSRFGAQVRAQVDLEVVAIGGVVDGAVARAASAGLDRTIADRLRALTAELERLEQRTRDASRVASERCAGDRRVLWVVVAGIVLANALLVALLLRNPDVAPVAEPMRIEPSAGARMPQTGPVQGHAPAADAADTASAASATNAGTAIEPPSPAPSPPPIGGSNLPTAAANAGPQAENAGASAGSNAAPSAPSAARKPAEMAGPAKTSASSIALPPKKGNPRTHKKAP